MKERGEPVKSSHVIYVARSQAKHESERRLSLTFTKTYAISYKFVERITESSDLVLSWQTLRFVMQLV